MHAGALIDTLPLKAKDLLQAGPTAILGGQGVGSLQGTHFNAAAVQVRPPGRRDRLSDALRIREQVVMSSHKVGWLSLAVRI